jgi:hypothetical protein
MSLARATPITRKRVLWAAVWLAFVVAAVLTIRAIGTGPSGGDEADTAGPAAETAVPAAALASCLALAEGDIVESQKYTPPESMRLPPEVPILSSGAATVTLPPHRWIPTNTLDGLPLQYARGGQIEGRLFLDRPLDPSMTLRVFLAEGGISFVQDSQIAPGATAERLLEFLGERGVAVDIGEYAGVLTWADPLGPGPRHHELWWSDGVFAYKLLAVRSAVEITNIARSMVCGLT